jgi:hypothetical protein
MTRQGARLVILGLSCAGVLVGTAPGGAPSVVLAQGAFSTATQVQQTQPGKIDRTLSGSRTGVLTKARNGTFWVDRDRYVLASGALIEDANGNPLEAQEMQGSELNVPVQYWVGTGETRNQITQLIVTLSE